MGKTVGVWKQDTNIINMADRRVKNCYDKKVGQECNYLLEVEMAGLTIYSSIMLTHNLIKELNLRPTGHNLRIWSDAMVL